MKKIISFLMFALILTLAACGGSSVSYPVEFSTGTVTSFESNVVTVEVDGYAPVAIVVEVSFNDAGTVTDVTVSNHMETPGFGKDVIDGDFTSTLVDEQSTLDSVDAVAGSTVTSEALVNAVKIAIEHFNAVNE